MEYKCKPITQKAKSSPFKMNESLVYGAATVAPKFLNPGEAIKKGMDSTKEKKEEQY